jgi:hypothetical protein
MSNQTTGAFEKLSIFVAKGVQLIALGIQYAKNVAVLISHRDNNL